MAWLYSLRLSAAALVMMVVVVLVVGVVQWIMRLVCGKVRWWLAALREGGREEGRGGGKAIGRREGWAAGRLQEEGGGERGGSSQSQFAKLCEI